MTAVASTVPTSARRPAPTRCAVKVCTATSIALRELASTEK